MPLTVVLSVGLDSSLLGTRNLVLQAEGYIVTSAASLKEAGDRFLAGDFDLVLLDHSLPAKDRARLTSFIRTSGSHTPVIFIAPGYGEGDAFADATCESDPKQLLMSIREVLVKTARRPAVEAATRLLK